MSGLRPHDVPEEVDPSDWTLRVTGAVSEPLHIEREESSEFPLETVTDEFECVEGWVAEDLSWRGIRVGSVLDRADPDGDADHVLVRAMDDGYACSFPRSRAADALLAVELDGRSLSVVHGGPARLVPTAAGSDCWESVKWVRSLDVRDSEPIADDTAEGIALGDAE
ncbi:Oxidoreductase molybdopterin binding domain-containing protein [Halorubrum aquaticum]|uniref:Oxidoreductase molybdopterin binding domain-containing protein n=1 Tax=Halorubrum aquaticum TaxID=387340 RepID=A0A1I2Z8R2_9EURY|nr:molybdopterin-dependent oxidoreductase [Halorubrum aquaticum]SFH33471.1 Oxidoreductase molybdopterin binding domain-containing protein [Halorubrum aquaticum]